RKVAGLNIIRGEEFVEIHPDDAAALEVNNGDVVRVTSRRGSVEAKVLISDKAPKGVVTMDFHFSESPVNVLTNPAHDPVSRIPEYKACAVRIEKR
ncbi:MAG TPA: formate dehydrogenase subunit alpha, partial [Deltaproteobacteria bacterium]|nr:formate dehydrogenase subunit alpha [Deltaproteobacteria bacterium]